MKRGDEIDFYLDALLPVYLGFLSWALIRCR